ncbi:MAG: type II CRISPR RNA-guided endonuclease Cas9, partial [Bacteroidetes bacterium]|nr:type II CRISPR RNA-guided endonuclease Cas9 [Bacteroidota bacterium]
MKKILGLDLGTTSIGWAFVREAESENEKSSIERIGVRVNPLTTDEQTDFEKGKTVSSNADRTLKRGARRNLERYKQRRKNLINVLLKANIITNETILTENEKNTTHSTYLLRAKAATDEILKEDFAKVLLMINKKRGYKSSRKAKNEDEGQIIDGMAVAKTLYDENITPGQYCYQILKQGKKHLPDFYRSDLKAEFEKVWGFQKQFYPEFLTGELKKAIEGQGKENTRKRILAITKVFTAENKGKDKKLEAYEWRSKAINAQVSKEELAFILTDINNNLNSSSGYLGAISDRSKELYFNKQTIGEYLYNQLKYNPHTRTKGQVFYRQDYLDEFDTIWETQAKFHKELTPELKAEVRDIIIFYQRKLKSQKGLVSFCELESKTIESIENGKVKQKKIGYKVAPKSSPLFQEFKIWQNLHNVKAQNKITKEVLFLNEKAKQDLFFELNIKGNLDKKYVVEFLGYKNNEWELNYSSIEGNRTNKALYECYFKILELEGYGIIDWESYISKNDKEKNIYDYFEFSKSVEKFLDGEFVNPLKKYSANEVKEIVGYVLSSLNINASILEFDATLQGKAFEQQSSYQLWHLLYSYVEDKSATGNEELYRLLNKKFGIKKEYAQMLANISFQQDYGNLSAKAMRKIFPFIKEFEYSEACEKVDYNHSSSKTKKENDERILKDGLTILPKNSLRNPVVEKILNQMVNVVNAIIADSTLGKPDEIRIELARELKKNAKERAEMTTNINAAKVLHEGIIKKLQTEFGIKNPTRNDIIRYKLYEELKGNGYHTLYSNTYISHEKLFSKEFDIEHIIPKSRLFDDSFSNKTLETRFHNDKKGDDTAVDFIERFFG